MATSYHFDLFVIGGGSGGVRCARIAAGHGARVGIAEERFWGGTCVNVGCVPKKIMVQASEYGAMAEDARGFGWDVDRGRHDWATLIANKNREIDRLNAVYGRLLGDAGVEIFEARATFEGPHELRVGERRVTAERIVVATGGHPIVQPPIRGRELGIVSDEAFFLPERPRRVLMVGGGYIGMEFAGIFHGLGSEVDVVYRQPLPLRGFDTELREALAESLTAQSFRLHPSQTVHAVEDAGDGVRRVTLTNGHVVEADLVYFAVGRAPNTAGLGLERAGVKTARNGGVEVDDDGVTSQPHVFAIGDVCNKLNLTPVAIAEGHALADRLFGRAPPRRWNLDTVAKAVFAQPPIGTVGLTEDEAAARGPADIFVARFTPMRHAMSGRAGHRALMKLVVDARTDRVLGAHMLGDDAPEIIQGLSVAINAGVTKAQFDQTVGVHPTSAEEFVTLRTRTRRVGEVREAAE